MEPHDAVRRLRANQAVRLGLRASSRNPELAFGKALIDVGGSLLSLLPPALAGLLIAGAIESGDVLRALAGLGRLQWPMLGALSTAAAISFTAAAAFWAGAVPLLAADAEMNQRPPPGNFTLLAGAGFARVASASALGWGLSLAHALLSTVALVTGAILFALRPSAGISALLAFAVAISLLGGLLLELLARLLVVRAATFAEGALAAFTGSLALVGARLGSLLLVSLAFFGLELLATMAGSTIGASISATAAFDSDRQLLALAPRGALFIASGAVLAWLEVSRVGALAAIAANEAGVLDAPEPAAPPAPVPTVLERPKVAEIVIEALPVEEPVIDALPAPEEPREPEENPGPGTTSNEER